MTHIFALFLIGGKSPSRPISDYLSLLPLSCARNSFAGGLRQSDLERNMGETCWPPWGLLGVLVATLTLMGSCEGSPSHSLQYFYTAVSEPGQGLPQFVIVGYVDGQLFVHYNSNSRKMVPRVSWMEEMDKEDPQYWDSQSQIAQGTEPGFRVDINTLRNRYNQTGGLHIVQRMYGCELRGDGSIGGYDQYGYDGRDFISFDKETLTWTAADTQAQETKRKWDANRSFNQGNKAYLEEICIEWLQKYLRYGNKTLLRKEPPKIKVTGRADPDNMESHICRADGFYPKDIEVVWTRDGDVWEQETQHGFVAPNSDGTYYTWISIKINPKDRDRFQCRVDHPSQTNTVNFAVEKPASAFTPTGIIIGCAVVGLVLLGIVVATLIYFKKRQTGYKPTSTSDKGSNSSGQGSNQNI